MRANDSIEELICELAFLRTKLLVCKGMSSGNEPSSIRICEQILECLHQSENLPYQFQIHVCIEQMNSNLIWANSQRVYIDQISDFCIPNSTYEAYVINWNEDLINSNRKALQELLHAVSQDVWFDNRNQLPPD